MPRSADLEQRLSYLELDARDIDRLAALRPVLEKEASRLVDAFYHHLLSYPATRQLLGDAAVRERLLIAQRDYLLSLAGPSLDDAYVEQRRAIGAVHERIGLEPRWYLGAYALYLSLLVPLVHEAHRHDAIEASRTIVSLQKLLFFDVQIAMEAYIDQHERQLQYFASELAKQGRRLARDFESQKLELQLTENRARAAEELASVATLVAGLAHEIGTPMGVIQGHANQLEAAVTDDDAKWRLRTIQEQIGRISKIIQTLLNIARPGKTQHVLVSLDAVVGSTLAFVSEELSRRGIAVHSELDAKATLRGDPERLQQLLLNLFLNAVDAMPNGGELRVALTRDAEGGVEIRVADTGQGISERDLPRIFEPFFTSKEAGTGNGLGLMVAKGIASDHGGRIEVESELGRGTEFRIHLPGASAAGRAEP